MNSPQYEPTAMHHQQSTLEGFTQMYAGNPPWDTGKPKSPFVAVAEQITGPLLDAGCGTGDTALFFAARGEQVIGIDFVEEAIRRARAKAGERGLAVEFLCKDVMTLVDWDQRFASVIDSGLFHIYHGEERQRYVRGLAQVLQPGGRLFLLSFMEDAPEGGVSREQLLEVFADGWACESLKAVHLGRGELSEAFQAEFPEAFPTGVQMWFAIIRRSV